MSEVYLAAARRPGGFTKLLVIKELRASLARDPEFLDMFLAEAQLAARLQHPNVVQTYEVGSSGGRYFIAMEYLEGQPLHQILSLGSERGGLGLAARLTVLAEMLDGLHYAHEATDYDGAELGIIHRDVSPHNVIVTYQGGVKIMDFGVAKVAHDHHHTMAGVLKGKLGYMSPEQARGEPVDRRADLFSVGVMLWECVTEHRMWEGLTELELLRRLGDGDLPSLQAVMPNVPKPLLSIWQRACAVAPERRYPSALSLQADLWDYLESSGGRVELRTIGEGVAAAFSRQRQELRLLLRQQLLLLPSETSVRRPAPGVHAPVAEGTGGDGRMLRHESVPPTQPEPLMGAARMPRSYTDSRTPVPAAYGVRWRLAPQPRRWPWLAAALAAVGVGGLAWSGLLPLGRGVARGDEVKASAAQGSEFGAAAPARAAVEDLGRQHRPLVEVSGDIEGAARLSSDKDYLLKYTTFVRPGATLSIEPGTRILGDSDTKAVLVVQPGGRLLAVGTPDRPIVFTSERPEGQRRAGDWGGVILLGNAPTNWRTQTGAPKRGRVEGIVEGGEYGGDSPNDDSGVLSYVRIEYAGTEIGPNNEVNGLTLAGVGRGTRLDHIQVRAAADDCFEFFGGTVDAHHLICQGTGDDAFDWDNGYQGRLQFLVAVFDPREPSVGGNGMEGDNDARGSVFSPVSRPVIYNATLCGTQRGEQHEHYGILARRSTQGLFANGLIGGFTAGVDLRGSNLGFVMLSTQFMGSPAMPIAMPESSAETHVELQDDDHGFDEIAWFQLPGRHNRVKDAGLDCGFLRGVAPKPAQAIAEFDIVPPRDGFFDTAARYRGAFRDASDDWDRGWAVWSAP